MLQYFQVHINLFNDEESSFVIDDENVSITLGPQVIVLGQSIMANITYQLFKRFAKSEKVLQVDHQKFLTENYVNVFAVVSCGELFEIRRYFNIAYFIIIIPISYKKLLNLVFTFLHNRKSHSFFMQ